MRTICPLDLQKILDTNQPVEILDIRPRGRFERTHISGAHWLPAAAAISLGTLFPSRELPVTEPLYLVSESGALARLIAHELEYKGFNNIVVVSGGMHAWQQSDLPIAGRISAFRSTGVRSATNAQFLASTGERSGFSPSKVSTKCN